MANLRVDKITSTETFETTGSVQFDGTGDQLNIPESTDFQLASSAIDFTIEAWVYGSNFSGAYTTITAIWNQSTGDQWILSVDTAGVLGFVWRPHSNSANFITGGTLSTDTWHHVAVTRSGNTFRLFVNGLITASGTNTGTTTNNTQLQIGKYASESASEWEGFISNLRIVKGTALYTSNFKPPMRELEVTAETVLLACQSKTDVTLEKTGKVIEPQQNAVASELTPGLLRPIVKSGGGSAITGSVEFDGTGDYLSVPNTTDLRLGSSDFTVEAWVNFSNGAVSNGVIAALWDNTNNQRSWNFYFDRSGNNLYFAGSTNGSSGNNSVSASIDIEDSNWYHVAASRSGSTIKLFVNGIESGSNTSVGTYYDNTTDLVTIGAQNHDNPTNYWKGFISNLRIVKGTALYTDDFIPPTRELKRVPGTVLLCCQDPNNPLTEATGKTITGYGDFQTADGVELITNGHFTSGTTGWSNDGDEILTVTSGVASVDRNGGSAQGQCYQTIITEVGKTYIVSVLVTAVSNGFQVYADSGSTTVSQGAINSTGIHYWTFTATSTSTRLDFSATQNVNGTASFDNVSVTLVEGSNKGSNFTPQVGDDRKVTFEGVTKINSNAYFYLPTGDTITRDSRSGRGISLGGAPSPSTARSEIIDFVTISSMGNSQDFGDLTQARSLNGGCASATRGICAGGYDEPVSSPGYVNTIDYITIAATGNAVNFGDLFEARNGLSGTSNSTRGVFGGGSNPSPASDTKKNTIDYITIASLGNAINFGDLSQEKRNTGCTGSAIRAIWAGGQVGPTITDVIDYVTISSTGNAADFGDLTANRRHCIGSSSSTRGIFAGGTTNPTLIDIIEYITMSSTGNSNDFGNLTDARSEFGGPSNKIRAVFMGGWDSPTYDNRIDYITIASTGDALDFGNLGGGVRGAMSGISDSHGGLG